MFVFRAAVPRRRATRDPGCGYVHSVPGPAGGARHRAVVATTDGQTVWGPSRGRAGTSRPNKNSDKGNTGGLNSHPAWGRPRGALPDSSPANRVPGSGALLDEPQTGSTGRHSGHDPSGLGQTRQKGKITGTWAVGPDRGLGPPINFADRGRTNGRAGSRAGCPERLKVPDQPDLS